MAFQRPTLSQIVERVRRDLESRMTSGSPVLPKSVIFVLSVVIAGAVHLLYGAIEFFSKQIFGDTATGVYLRRLASIFGVFPVSAGFARGPVTFTGSDGSIIPAQTRLQRADEVLFETESQVTITSGSVTVMVRALEPGVEGNTDVGIQLTLVSPIAGVQSRATVDGSGIVNGVAEEGDESLRERFLDRVRFPPQGGSLADYRRWAREVPGVTRSWSYREHMGPGTVGVTFVTDGLSNIIPDSTKVNEVKDYIDAIRPVTDELYVFAPVAKPLDFDIEIDPDTPAVRAQVEAELRDLIQREAEPGGTIPLTHIHEAISIAAGEYDHKLNDPTSDVVSSTGELIVMGSITWGP